MAINHFFNNLKDYSYLIYLVIYNNNKKFYIIEVLYLFFDIIKVELLKFI